MRLRTIGPALLCVFVFLFAVLLIWPVVESGVVDDWSVLRSAWVLADTGHIQYNGWEAPMLGWMLYTGAAAIKLFGPSFTVVRLLTVAEGALSLFLFQRILTRAGVRSRASVIGTLTLAFSPVFLMTSVLFISDLPALLTILVCLYACIRALQSATERTQAGWICFAALSNAVLGTTRQTAWLGLLVMVPATLWLLRKHRAVLVAGVGAWFAGVAMMGAALLWFRHQPYILPERLLPGALHLRLLRVGLRAVVRIGLDVVLFTLPVALAYLVAFRKGSAARLGIALGLTAGCFLVGFGITQGNHLLAPFLLFVPAPQTAENTFISFMMPIMGPSPSHLARWFQPLLTVLVGLGTFAILAGVLAARREQVPEVLPQPHLTWRELLLLVVPFSAAYLLLLMPRAIFIFTVDRYLLPLLPFALLLQLRFFAHTQGRELPVLTILPLVLSGLYSVFTLHDLFAIYRANLAGINELRAAGIARDAINGGFEYNAMSQLLVGGYTHAAGIRMPDGRQLQPSASPVTGECVAAAADMTPAVHAEYGLAYNGSACPRVPGFAPVEFRTWLPPFHRVAYVVKTTRVP